MRIPESNLPRVVVLGAGFGGLQLCKRINKQKFQVVLLDKHNYHTFQPLLYQVATAGLEPDSIAYPIRKIFKSEKENFFFRVAKVESIVQDENLLHTSAGELHFDYLVVATGSTTNFFGNKKLEKNAMPMKTVPESLNLRSLFLQNFEQALLTTKVDEVEKLLNFAVVGGGPTGTELAGAIAELKSHVLPNDYPDIDFRKMTIHLLEAGPSLLAGMSKKSGEKARKYLETLGVKVWMNTAVDDYDGEIIVTNTGKKIPSKFLIWAAGVKGSLLDGFTENQIVRGNRLSVNEYSLVEGTQNIFAIGDIASMTSKTYPKGHPMMAQPAIQQGQLLAKNLERILEKNAPKPFRYKDKGSMATIGRNKAVAEVGKLKFKGLFAWVVWMFVHLLALVGFRNKMVTFVNWLYAYFNYEKGARLIIRPFNRKESKPEEETTEIVQSM